MCGRYTIIAKAEEIEKRFDVEVPEIFAPRYNAAPTQILPVITNENPEGISFFRWGLIPSWAQNLSIGAKLINARAETILEKPSFSQAFKKRRCLVIADSYYEWKVISKKSRIPYRILLNTEKLFSFAGLWETFTDGDQSIVHSFTIVTTGSNSTTSHIHQRMPVILNSETEKIWLNDDSPASQHLEILAPYPADEIKCYTISNMVNSVRNDNEQLIRPTPAMDQSGNPSLFN